MQAILGALLSSAGFGGANIVIKKALEDVPTHQALFMSFASGLVFIFIYLLFTSGLIFFDYNSLALMAFFGFCEVVLYFSLYKAFDSGEVTIANATIGTYPILVTLFSVIFLNAVVSLFDWIFIIIMIFAALLVTIDIKGLFEDGLDKKDLVKGLNWIIIAMLAHAVYFPSLGYFIESGDLMAKLFIIKIFATLIFLVISTIQNRKLPLPKVNKIAPLSLLGLMEVIGWIGFGLAVFNNSGQVGVVTAALNAGSLITAVLAFFILKERLKGTQYIGILIISIALIVQGLISS